MGILELLIIVCTLALVAIFIAIVEPVKKSL